MAKLKVIQVRGIVGRPERQKRTLDALGLHGINRSRVHEDTPQIRGMLAKVPHLVKVEDVEE